MWRHYVYLHRQTDTGEPFYVGKGASRRGSSVQNYERAHWLVRPNIWWSRVAAKHGVTVEIVASCVDDQTAQDLEIRLIRKIGRRNHGTGPLVNLTDGGDGHLRLVTSDEVRKKRSLDAKRPRSQAWIDSMRAARKNGGNGGVVKEGDKLPEEWRKNIGRSKLRPVLDRKTCVVYAGVGVAAQVAGISQSYMSACLGGCKKNRTGMEFL